MKKVFHISTAVDEPALLENLVEKLAMRHSDHFQPSRKLTTDYVSVSTASTQTYVTGTVQIEEGEGREAVLIQIPFITQFFFTCIREKNEEYRLAWGTSMS